MSRQVPNGSQPRSLPTAASESLCEGAQGTAGAEALTEAAAFRKGAEHRVPIGVLPDGGCVDEV